MNKSEEYMLKEKLPKIMKLHDEINGLLEDVIEIANIIETDDTISKHAYNILAQITKEKCFKIHDSKESIFDITKEDFFSMLYDTQNKAEDDKKIMDIERFKKGVLALTKRIREIEQPNNDYDECAFEDAMLSDLEGYVKTGEIDEDKTIIEQLNKIFGKEDDEK